jgi:glyceraldehyde 3-phosphate dehydrogenase
MAQEESSMPVQIGINGFGRIGRIAFRAMQQRHGADLKVVAINDLVDAQTNAHLLKYDTNYGAFPGTVAAGEGAIIVNGEPIKVYAERDPAQIPWGQAGADIIIESTGFFTDATKARAHLQAGAKKVVITAPARNEDITIVLGVNGDKYDPARHHVISNASCTTNGLAPVAKVLFDRWGIDKGILSTVHAYTNSQKLQDLAAKDLRDARAAAMNIVPSATGAARAVGLVIPELQGKFTGVAFRVPVSTVSIVDFTALLTRTPGSSDSDTIQAINAAMKEYSEGAMKGILAYTEEPLVSSDLKGNSNSSIFSALDTLAIGNMVKVLSWYDNEWGYSCRVADLCHFIGERGV